MALGMEVSPSVGAVGHEISEADLPCTVWRQQVAVQLVGPSSPGLCNRLLGMGWASGQQWTLSCYHVLPLIQASS